ncbi:hypothetical protein [Clostridium sp.]|uniref:hypothetical protein n=1 Tax=Clostridium sp. TaxID=1506 RepID=UPI0034640F8B
MKKGKKIFITILYILQIAILIPSIVLEILSKEKMGVMRYLVYKNDVLQQGAFNSNLIRIYSGILIVISLALIIYGLRNIGKIRGYSLIVIIGAIAFSIMTVVSFNLTYMQGMLAYHFFLISFLVITVIQYIKIIVVLINNR